MSLLKPVSHRLGQMNLKSATAPTRVGSVLHWHPWTSRSRTTVAEQLLGTGVELRLPSRWADEDQAPPAVNAKTSEVCVEFKVFADLQDNERHIRVGGTMGRGGSVSLARDPTTELLRIAHEARDTHLGDLLGDLRIGGCHVTRFEFHAAPFRIELADDLFELLATSWREHPPR